MIRRPARLLMTVMALTAAGCGAPRLQGTVVSGPAASVQWVDAQDPRLQADGLASARVTVLLDPERFNPKTIGEASTDPAGRFSVPLNEPGAGLLIMDVEVRAQRSPDHGGVAQRLRLPRRGQSLLITLVPGGAPAPGSRGTLLDRTLEDARPYMTD